MNENQQTNAAALVKIALVRLFSAMIILALLLCFTAGDFFYWNAWLYIISLVVLMIFGLIWLYKNDPALLEKRLKMKEKEKAQKLFSILAMFSTIGIFVLSGLDHRYQWTHVPLWGVMLAEIVLVASYLLCFEVMKQNSYASRVIEIQEGQKLIDTGLYSIVRHPMYMSMIFLYMASPLVLGSLIAFIPSVLFPILLAIRIKNEEQVLREGLPGYKEYTTRVRYKLIPHIW